MNQPYQIDQSIPTDTPEGVSWNLNELRRALAGGLWIGAPNNPLDPGDGSLPDGTKHNGTPGNFAGSWSDNLVTAPGAFTARHNLDLGFESAAKPNVFWFANLSHDGTGGGSLSVEYAGGPVARDTIELVLRASGRTVDPTHPATVLLFFVPVV